MSREVVVQVSSRAVADAEFRELLHRDPLVAIADYELTPSERSDFVMSARVFTEGLHAIRLLARAAHDPSFDPSTSSLGSLMELSWAAGRTADSRADEPGWPDAEEKLRALSSAVTTELRRRRASPGAPTEDLDACLAAWEALEHCL